MPKLYACIISPAATNTFVAVARQFAHAIEVVEGGVLFDVSGLERLIGQPNLVAKKILAEMRKQRVSGSVAVANTVDTAMLLARQKVQSANFSLSSEERSEACTLNTPDMFEQLPLTDLDIERDTLNVFSELGIRNVKDLLAVPHDDLVGRYGKSFQAVIDVLEQKGRSVVTPNVKEDSATWKFDLDQPVEDFEQLIFVVNHGLEKLFNEIGHQGLSTEHLDISFRLSNKAERDYEIKTSFPTLDRSFWLKLVNLRISLDPPEATIVGVNVVAYFTKPRPAQRGLYAVTKPEPESLLLTVGKLKKLVGEDNVGIPVLLNDRLVHPFKLDADKLPTGRESIEIKTEQAIIALTYFRPPLAAEVLVRDGRLVFVKTRAFSGHILATSGMWSSNSHWWDTPWRTREWDIEVETSGVFRLSRARDEWFLTGEYD